MVKLPKEDLEHILLRTRQIWEELRGYRLFITGGTGFFGCWLLESFLYINESLSLDAQATVLTRDARAFARKCPHLANHSSLHCMTGDVRDLDRVHGAYDGIIHAATEASAKQAADQPLEMLSTILDGTKRTLDFARRCGARKFLLTSSGAVYGDQPPGVSHIGENYAGAPDCLDARSVYAEGKRAAELMSVLYAKDCFEVKIARCFAFVGPHLPLDAHFAIGNFLRDGMRGGPIIVGGDGTPKRSYLHAADLAVWLWTILFRGNSNQAYNVGSEQAFSIIEVAQAVAEALDPSLKIIVSLPHDGATPLRQYVPSTRRAREGLGLQQHFGLVESIRRTAAWHRQNERALSSDPTPFL